MGKKPNNNKTKQLDSQLLSSQNQQDQLPQNIQKQLPENLLDNLSDEVQSGREEQQEMKPPDRKKMSLKRNSRATDSQNLRDECKKHGIAQRRAYEIQQHLSAIKYIKKTPQNQIQYLGGQYIPKELPESIQKKLEALEKAIQIKNLIDDRIQKQHEEMRNLVSQFQGKLSLSPENLSSIAKTIYEDKKEEPGKQLVMAYKKKRHIQLMHIDREGQITKLSEKVKQPKEESS